METNENNLKSLSTKGSFEETTMPDTLDLADRASLGIRAITDCYDRDNDYYSYFANHIDSNPPFRAHVASDYTCTPKLLEASSFLRHACGRDEWLDVEQTVTDIQLARIDKEDGIPYGPYSPKRPWHSTYEFGAYYEKYDWCWVGLPGLYLRMLSGWREASIDEQTNSHIESQMRMLVKGLRKMAIDKEDYAYFPDAGGIGHQFAFPRQGWQHEDEPQGEAESVEGSVLDSQSRSIHGLSHHYILTGDEDAIELATRLKNFCMLPKMWGGLVEEVGVCGCEQGHFHSHCHPHMSAFRALLAYGYARGDDQVLEFVRRGYEHARTYMVPRLGFLPANGVGDAPSWMEGCTLAGVVGLAIRLSDYGVSDYWDDVDACVRNHLVEMQHTDLEAIKEAIAASPNLTGRRPFPGQEKLNIPPEEFLGLITGWADTSEIAPAIIMSCCIGNGAMALYYAWESAVRCDGDTATINLLINRASQLIDVDSYLPYEGRVILRNRRATCANIRIPGWVDRRQVRVTVSGIDRSLSMVGNFLLIDNLSPSDVIELTFPIKESQATYTVHHRVWRRDRKPTLIFRGSTCVSIDPPSDGAPAVPMYQREYMRSNTTPMKTTNRFIPERIIRFW